MNYTRLGYVYEGKYFNERRQKLILKSLPTRFNTDKIFKVLQPQYVTPQLLGDFKLCFGSLSMEFRMEQGNTPGQIEFSMKAIFSMKLYVVLEKSSHQMAMFMKGKLKTEPNMDLEKPPGQVVVFMKANMWMDLKKDMENSFFEMELFMMANM